MITVFDNEDKINFKNIEIDIIPFYKYFLK